MDFQNIPMGFAMGIAMHKDAEEAYDKLTEAEKEKIIFECKDAKSRSEINRIINRLSGKLV